MNKMVSKENNGVTSKTPGQFFILDLLHASSIHIPEISLPDISESLLCWEIVSWHRQTLGRFQAHPKVLFFVLLLPLPHTLKYMKCYNVIMSQLYWFHHFRAAPFTLRETQAWPTPPYPLSSCVAGNPHLQLLWWKNQWLMQIRLNCHKWKIFQCQAELLEGRAAPSKSNHRKQRPAAIPWSITPKQVPWFRALSSSSPTLSPKIYPNHLATGKSLISSYHYNDL